jgi:chromosome segregation ATPase
MKRVIHILALTTWALYAHCQTPAQNEVKAEGKVEAAKENLKAAEKELDAAYPPFKKDAEKQISANAKKIKELRAELVKPNRSPLNDASKQKIDDLEKRNIDLRNRLYVYETERSDWEVFKAKFNHDMDNLHAAFHDFSKDLKK